MTTLFVPAPRIMGEHFSELAEFSQCHPSAEAEKGGSAWCRLHLPGRPGCKRSQRAPAKPRNDRVVGFSVFFRVSVTTGFIAIANIQVIF